MGEYISREAVINITAETGAWETQNRVKELPAANVQPVKQGRWVCEFYNDVFDVYQADCSVCKKESTDKYDKVSESFEYCPHCGAKMNSDTNG